jgi:hypothetical protein
MNAEQRLEYLLETQWAPTNRAVLFADITAVVGLEATAMVVGTIKAASAANPLMDTILIAMSSVGLSLSTSERQGVIDMLADAGEWPDEVKDAVKALGGVYKPRWQAEGYESEPTLELITKQLQRQDWHERFDAATNTLGTVEQDAGIAAIRAIADEMAGA